MASCEGVQVCGHISNRRRREHTFIVLKVCRSVLIECVLSGQNVLSLDTMCSLYTQCVLSMYGILGGGCMPTAWTPMCALHTQCVLTVYKCVLCVYTNVSSI